MLLAFLLTTMLAVPQDPSVLTVPVVVVVDHQAAWIERLHDCENPGNKVPKKLDTNGKYSYGYVHFQMGTWLSYGKKFGATPDNIYDDELQKKVARSMLDAGGQSHWFWCSQKLGDYPR
jgi:hypothetical protein